MVKGQQSSLVLLALLFVFLAIIFLLKKLEAPPTPTTTTTVPATTTLPPSTTTSTTLPVGSCKGINTRICGLGTKSNCLIYKNCCYWDLNASKCKPQSCSDISKDYCISCGCTPS